MHFILWTKGSIENTNFDIFKCPDENLPNSSSHFPQVSFSSNFALLFSVMKHTPLHTFLGQTLYTLQKETNKS